MDRKKRSYQYGQFDKVKKFSDCADRCVKDVSSRVLDAFRGYEWDCKNRECRCLYDDGTLNGDKRARNMFDRTNRHEDGKGPIERTKKDKNVYCAKLDSVKFVGMMEDGWGDDEEDEDEAEVEVGRALRGSVN